MANDEDEYDPHEHDGQVVLLLPPGVLRGHVVVPGHRHLATVAVLHVLVDLGVDEKMLFFNDTLSEICEK